MKLQAMFYFMFSDAQMERISNFSCDHTEMIKFHSDDYIVASEVTHTQYPELVKFNPVIAFNILICPLMK